MDNVKNLDVEIEKKINRINEIEQQIKQLDSEKKELKKNIDKLKAKKETIEVLQSIYKVNSKNSKRVFLQHDTKTTPIIDDFFYSDKEFLIFENAFYFSGSGTDVSLVVAKVSGAVNYVDSNLTMTVLKQNVHTMISEHVWFYKDEDDRMEALGKELAEVYKSNTKNTGLIPFKTPCLLGGQTYSDQTDLGKEQYGNTVLKDKRYGETTKFLIIGVELD